MENPGSSGVYLSPGLAQGTSLLSQPLPGDSRADLEGPAQPGLPQARGEGVMAILLENPWVWWVWLPGSPGASQVCPTLLMQDTEGEISSLEL